MITCKNCGCETLYTGVRCPKCNTVFSFTEEEIEAHISALGMLTEEKRYAEAVERYHILADAGYTPAEKEYAKILERGQLVKRDLNAAMKYFYRAAKKNDAYSAYKYSRLATRENDDAARFWLIYSAILGCEAAYPTVAEEFAACGYEEDAHYFYSLAAACDDVESIVTMAKRYFNGIGTAPSQDYAKWYMDKLTVPPIYAIKLAYRLRNATSKEPPQILPKNYNGLLRRLSVQAREYGFGTAYLRLVEILSDRGDTDATAELGTAVINGVECKQYLAEGLRLLTKAAALGCAKAYIALGNVYTAGTVTEKNEALALSYYEKGGECGSAASYEAAGDLCRDGDAKDVARAYSFYTLSAKLGSAEAQRKADAIRLEGEKIYKAALEAEAEGSDNAFGLYFAASEMGHAAATLKAAKCLECGTHVKKDRKKAFLLYKKAAELGETAALIPLGACYANGVGTQRSYELAKATLIKAERSGQDGAHELITELMEQKIKKLSARLYSGAMRLIYMKKFKTAKTYLDIAADLAHPKAIYTLGCLYEFGIGVPCDKEKGFALYEKAYSLFFRDPRSQYKLAVLKMLKSGNLL